MSKNLFAISLLILTACGAGQLQAPMLQTQPASTTWQTPGQYATWGTLIGKDDKSRIVIGVQQRQWERQGFDLSYGMVAFDAVSVLNPTTGQVTNHSLSTHFRQAAMGPQGRYVVGYPVTGEAPPGQNFTRGEFVVLDLHTGKESTFNGSFEATYTAGSNAIGGLTTIDKRVHAEILAVPSGRPLAKFPLDPNWRLWVCGGELIVTAPRTGQASARRFALKSKTLVKLQPGPVHWMQRCLGPKRLLMSPPHPKPQAVFDDKGAQVSSLDPQMGDIIAVSANAELLLARKKRAEQQLVLMATATGKVVANIDLQRITKVAPALAKRINAENILIWDRQTVYFASADGPQMLRWTVADDKLERLQPRSTTQVIAGLRGRDWRMVQRAARTVGFYPRLSSPQIVELLCRWTAATNAQVQAAAVWALGQIGSHAGPRAYSAIESALRSSANDFRRRANQPIMVEALVHIDRTKASAFIDANIRPGPDAMSIKAADAALKRSKAPASAARK